MNQDLKQLFGKRVHAPDGELGRVKDFLFDAHAWVVRYLVLDTGTWLAERQILLPPHAFRPHGFGPATAGAKILETHVTRKEIGTSPILRSHHPVSRTFEESYYTYFGWHPYWLGGFIWGDEDMPQAVARPIPAPKTEPLRNPLDDVHLESTRKIFGYRIQASDRAIGELRSATMNGHSWVIRDWVVATGYWYAGKRVFLLPESFERISHPEEAVFVNLSWKDIQQTRREEVVEAGVDPR